MSAFSCELRPPTGENLIWVRAMLKIETLRQHTRTLLIDARKTQAVSQRMLAKRLGRPQSYVSKYECGERRLDLPEVIEILAALNEDPIEFVKRLRQFIE
jgi:predicted transcriptional regulator